jgi:hypothetical protein
VENSNPEKTFQTARRFSAMRERKPISKKQTEAIRTYIKQGYSANKIQKKLQRQDLGIQRKKLLAEVRKVKGTKAKAYPQKYTPKKYRRVTPRARRPVFGGKHIAVFRYVTTSRYRKMAKKLGLPKYYSARFELYGSGKDLAIAIGLVKGGIVPRWENPHVECSARDFLNNPYKYGEKGIWLDRPTVES